MGIRNTMEEALQKGEKIKDQFLSDLMRSQTVNQLLQNEVFLKSLTKVITTKYEIEKSVKTNVKSFLKALNLPSQEDLSTVKRKLHRLEDEMDILNKKVHSSNGASRTKVAKTTQTKVKSSKASTAKTKSKRRAR